MRQIIHPTVRAAVPGDVIGEFAAELTARFDLRACWFEPFPFDALLPRIEPGRIVVPAAEPGVRSFTDWYSSDGVELPVRYGALTLGRYVLVPRTSTCGVAFAPTRRDEAIAGAALVGEQLARFWTVTDLRVSAEREGPPWPTSCS